MNINFKVTGLTRLEINPESTTPEADALTSRLSELLKFKLLTKFVLLPRSMPSSPVPSLN